ncbi:LuxR C-terminal-related transcriptional regulator [Burkholderia ubonensis]|uniref:LuxR C-terminal-related transcriptional regulator n=1 Tax=Burkholderia ubonensis TaxID=101571 RepID=UPI002ABE321D|nr:LuxR C-terminal-related transcriptional regulator [Burkholderia ubonensis]
MNRPTDPDAPRWDLSLIQTKMAPPRPPRCRVTRRPLLKKLAAAAQHTVTLIIAPAGFGKTTMLSEWCEVLRTRHQLVAWLSLDSDDDDPDQFGAYLVAALSRGTGGVGQHAERLLRKDPLTPGRTVVSVLLNEIATCGKKVFLVLDDFDRLVSAPVRAAVSRLLRYAPDNFHVLLGARSEPKLALTSFQAQGQLLRIGESDLRFSADDAQAFFARAGTATLDRPAVELLHDATEGWIAGLQLASLSLHDATDAAQVARDLAGNRFGIDAYLDDAVLARLPPAVYQFLLRTSILDRLSPGLCDAVMGANARSWEKLDWLESHNLFTRALDDERQWFRYHALMSDALRRRAARQLADEMPKLHRRASQWLAAERQWPEAVRHALAAGDAQQAATWVEHCAMALIDHSDVSMLLSLIGKLPRPLVESRLRLRLANALALAFLMHTPEAGSMLQSVKSDLARAAVDGAQAGSGNDAMLQIEAIAVAAAVCGFRDDSYRSLDLGREAAASPLPVSAWVRRIGESAQIFGLTYDGRFDEVEQIRREQAVAPGSDREPLYAGVYRECMFGLNVLVNGRLPEAAALFESALAYAEANVCRHSAAAAVPAGYLAAVCYEQNDLARARQLINDRSAITAQACPLGSLSSYCRTAARLHARHGDIASALLCLEQGTEIADARHWLRLRASCDADTVRLCLQRGWLERAKETAAGLAALMPEQPPAPMGSFLETWASWCEVQARLDIATGRSDRAAERLDELKHTFARAGMKYLEARTSLLRALALEQANAHEAASAALEDALRYAQSNGMISSFVDEGEPSLRLLTRWTRDTPDRAGIQRAFVDRLLAAFDPRRGQAGDDDPRAARHLLSPREIEILNHIAHGLSNKEIGRALRVAPETIKWHLKNIFEKLKVGSRFEAVQSGLGVTPIERGDAKESDTTPSQPRST